MRPERPEKREDRFQAGGELPAKKMEEIKYCRLCHISTKKAIPQGWLF
jgi:hypothetical protein